jgi:phosphoglycolate phosphatase
MPPSRIVILDLDGTLLDTSARHYAVYLECAQDNDMVPLNLDAYWQLRRQGQSNLDVLLNSGLSASAAGKARHIWESRIEAQELLKTDRLFPGIFDWLKFWSAMFRFVLVTLRARQDNLEMQLRWLGLDSCLRSVYCAPPRSIKERTKAAEVPEHLRSQVFAWVGDTELDIQGALEIEARPMGVASGMRTKEALIASGAWRVYDWITDIQGWD